MPHMQVLFRSEAREKVLRGAAERTGDAVGNGTTTSTLLAHTIVADGMRNIAAGARSRMRTEGLKNPQTWERFRRPRVRFRRAAGA